MSSTTGARIVVVRVTEITGGGGVAVVIGGVGRDTFAASLDRIGPLGRMISFGNAPRPVDPVRLVTLAAKGSIGLARTTLAPSSSIPPAATRWRGTSSGSCSRAMWR